MRLGGDRIDRGSVARCSVCDAPEFVSASSDGLSAPKEPEPTPMEEYRWLASEADDPEDSSGFLMAIHASGRALTLPLLMEE